MLGAYVIVVKCPGLFNCVLNDLLGLGRLWQLAHRNHIRSALDRLFHLKTKLLYVHVQVLEDRSSHAAAFLDQAEQDVLGTYIFVVKSLGLLVGQGHNLTCSVCETLKHLLPRKPLSLPPVTQRSDIDNHYSIISQPRSLSNYLNCCKFQFVGFLLALFYFISLKFDICSFYRTNIFPVSQDLSTENDLNFPPKR